MGPRNAIGKSCLHSLPTTRHTHAAVPPLANTHGAYTVRAMVKVILCTAYITRAGAERDRRGGRVAAISPEDGATLQRL